MIDLIYLVMDKQCNYKISQATLMDRRFIVIKYYNGI